MGFKTNGLQARTVKRRALSRNQVAAKERLRLERLASAEARIEREIAEAEEWAKRNPPSKLPPSAKIRIEIPGLPTKTITVRRWPDGRILAGNRETTAKQLGRKIGMLLDQFLPP
jgi:hypothetical protein